MRILRSLALALIALAAPISRGAAQTCVGTAMFSDGRARLGVAEHYNSDFNDLGASFVYGIHRSFYAGVSYDNQQASHGGPSSSGPGAIVGYQIHLGDSPFQLCPQATVHFSSAASVNTIEYGFGGSLGYLVELSDGFAVVPAAGIRWLNATSTSDAVDAVSGGTSQVSARGSSSEVSMEVGFVFNRTITISPGLLVPSQSNAKTIYTLGFSINWAKPVSR